MTIRGIAYPFSRSTTSLPAARSDDDVIGDNIRRILSTPRGSRVMRPGVGSDVFRFVFENTGPVLRSRIDVETRRAIEEGEPRARVVRVGISESKVNGGRQVTVLVTYEVQRRIRTTSVSFTSPIG